LSQLNKLAQSHSELSASAGKNADGSPADVYGYGQIVYKMQLTSPNATEHFLRAVDLWFSKSKEYHSYNNRTLESLWFTQAVWKELKKVGIGIAVGAEDQCGSDEEMWIIVNYDRPSLASESQFQRNVEAKPSKTEAATASNAFQHIQCPIAIIIIATRHLLSFVRQN